MLTVCCMFACKLLIITNLVTYIDLPTELNSTKIVGLSVEQVWKVLSRFGKQYGQHGWPASASGA